MLQFNYAIYHSGYNVPPSYSFFLSPLRLCVSPIVVGARVIKTAEWVMAVASFLQKYLTRPQLPQILLLIGLSRVPYYRYKMMRTATEFMIFRRMLYIVVAPPFAGVNRGTSDSMRSYPSIMLSVAQCLCLIGSPNDRSRWALGSFPILPYLVSLWVLLLTESKSHT